MPVDYGNVDAIASAAADIYAEGENALIALLTRQLQAGGFDDDTTRWAARKLTEIRALRRTATLVVDEMQRDGAIAIRAAVADGWRSGNATALTDLAEASIGDIGPAARVADQRAGTAVQALADATVAEMRPACAAVLRSADDAYRRAVAGATARRLAGARDTRRAAQDAWTGLARQGITGFTGAGGRRWRLFSYAEMGVRTAVGRAAVIGETDVIRAAGLAHCYVEDNPRECPLCLPWENKILALDAPATPPAVATLAEAQQAGLHHPNCFPAGVLVSAPSGLVAAHARRYEGEIVVIHTAGGDELPVTPNHPILTPEGWVAAGALKVGDRVLRHRGWREQMLGLAGAASGLGPGDEQVPARVGDIHHALRQARPMSAISVPGAAEQFHGDGSDGDVDTVFTDGELPGRVLPQLGQGLDDLAFLVGRPALRALPPGGAPFEILSAADLAAHGGVGGLGERGSLCGRHAGLAAPHHLTGGEHGAALADPVAGDLRADAMRGRDLALRLAGDVTPDEIIDLGRRKFASHVYNLQTSEGWYLAAGLVVSNCRHRIRLWAPGTRITASRRPDPGGYAAEQEQRRLERGLRAWRERYAAAFNDETRGYAAARIAGWAGRLQDHLDAHPRLPRKSYREFPGAGFVAPAGARTDRDAAHLAPH